MNFFISTLKKLTTKVLQKTSVHNVFKNRGKTRITWLGDTEKMDFLSWTHIALPSRVLRGREEGGCWEWRGQILAMEIVAMSIGRDNI
jgi:hypothetical protein